MSGINLALCLLISLPFIICQEGWSTYLGDNTNEFENVEIPWTKFGEFPEWLQGTYIKNGPARSNFGGEHTYANLVDDWAKLHKFNIDSDGVKFSGKFLKTPLYKKCEAAGDIVPHFTMGAVVPGFGIEDFPTIGANGGDNTMVIPVKVGDEWIATTDLPIVNRFNISTLEFIDIFDPKLHSTSSSAHWRKEPGTDNLLNFHIKGTPGVWETLHLYRYPGGDLHNPQEVGSFHLDHSTMIHMFSVTENYAVFFVYPISVDMVCAMTNLLQNLLGCITWSGDRKPTDVVVMSLLTGNVVSHTKAKGLYSTHHINAYEVHEQEDTVYKVIVDIVEAPWYALANSTDRSTMLNWQDNGALENDFQIERFTIDITHNEISSEPWPNDASIPYVNGFDFPLINPEYEGKPYCYSYGQALVQNYRQYLIKKNVCDSTEDKVWFEENFYNGEPMFVARPGAELEDDGVLLVIMFNGFTQESHIVVLDGQTFVKIAEASLPEVVPMSIHGAWVPEIV